jgi:pyruvate dehydrogenase E1 component alpha subunit
MQLEITAQQLIDFEKKVEETYSQGVIRGPIHLRNGNETQLVNIFKEVACYDYVFSTWASHLHALLKGVPRNEVLQKILDGKSITLNFPEHHFFSSAIVGGICPISVGVAAGLKSRIAYNPVLSHPQPQVFCFIGDMASLTGVASESVLYSIRHDLPITFVVEDNNKSVGTPTRNISIDPEEVVNFWQNLAKDCENCKIVYYKYELTFPHSGVGSFVSF